MSTRDLEIANENTVIGELQIVEVLAAPEELIAVLFHSQNVRGAGRNGKLD